MAIKLKDYRLQSGIKLKTAYLGVNQLSYLPRIREVTFSVCVYADEITANAIENIISGHFYLDETSEGVPDLEKLIEESILYKINVVKDKTEEECNAHNINVTSWLDLWEYSYKQFNVADSSEDEEDEDVDEYLEAARILLEGE